MQKNMPESSLQSQGMQEENEQRTWKYLQGKAQLRMSIWSRVAEKSIRQSEKWIGECLTQMQRKMDAWLEFDIGMRIATHLHGTELLM